MPFDLANLGSLTIAGFASSVLTLLIATVWKPYLSKYAEEMAKHLATQENFKEVLKQAFQNAYATEAAKRAVTKDNIQDILNEAFKKAHVEEAGKREAAHDDFDRVLFELRNITETTKTIETKVNEDYWLRQMIWLQKRDTYIRVLQAFSDQEHTWTMILDVFSRYEDQLEEAEDNVEFEKEMSGLNAELTAGMHELEKASSVAQLMLSSKAAEITNTTVRKIIRDGALDDMFLQKGYEGFKEGLRNLRAFLELNREALVREAQFELQLQTPTNRKTE